MIYLAPPYRHPDPFTMRMRIVHTQTAFDKLIEQGEKVICPILYLNRMEKDGTPWDGSQFKEYSLELLKKSKALYVLTLDGWDLSPGLLNDIKIAEQLAIPVTYLNHVK